MDTKSGTLQLQKFDLSADKYRNPLPMRQHESPVGKAAQALPPTADWLRYPRDAVTLGQ